jgi:hypothetical protein
MHSHHSTIPTHHAKHPPPQFDLRSLRRVAVAGQLGGATVAGIPLRLPLTGDSPDYHHLDYHHLQQQHQPQQLQARCFSSHPTELRPRPSGPFSLSSATLTELQLVFVPTQQGRRRVLVNVVGGGGAEGGDGGGGWAAGERAGEGGGGGSAMPPRRRLLQVLLVEVEGRVPPS